jgi:hypothetical protein
MSCINIIFPPFPASKSEETETLFYTFTTRVILSLQELYFHYTSYTFLTYLFVESAFQCKKQPKQALRVFSQNISKVKLTDSTHGTEIRWEHVLKF